MVLAIIGAMELLAITYLYSFGVKYQIIQVNFNYSLKNIKQFMIFSIYDIILFF